MFTVCGIDCRGELLPVIGPLSDREQATDAACTLFMRTGVDETWVAREDGSRVLLLEKDADALIA